MSTLPRFAVLLTLAFMVGVLATLVWQEMAAPSEATPPLPVAPVVPDLPDYSAYCDAPAPEGFNEAVEAAASEFGVSPWVLAVTAYRESDCRPGVTGTSGEIGMLQIGPRWWASSLKTAGIIESDSDLYDMRTNLRAAAWIFAALQKRSDDTWTVFRRYNGSGPAARAYADAQTAALASYGDL